MVATRQLNRVASAHTQPDIQSLHPKCEIHSQEYSALKPNRAAQSKGCRAITILDCEADPVRMGGIVYRWNGYSEKGGQRSLFRYVEAHSERLRQRYIGWIHDLGESRLHGKRLIDRLVLEDGFSYWWMTPFVEQNPWKSPAVVDAIRLLALEEILIQEGANSLQLVSDDPRLDHVLRNLSKSIGIRYEKKRPPKVAREWIPYNIYHRIPNSLRALISLVLFLRRNWKFRCAAKSDWFTGTDSLFFCSYFDNIDAFAAAAGRFYSYYWTDLHDLLSERKRKTNWLHFFVPSPAVSNPSKAIGWLRGFNLDQQKQGCHAFVHSYLSTRAVIRVLRRWFTLILIRMNSRSIKQAFTPAGSQLSFWPLMKADWMTSMTGPVAITNLLWIELLDRALHDLPYQKKGFYLFENQPWERALIHAWRKCRHGQLIGVAHTTVAFWNLCYFNDPRTLKSEGPNRIPQPDIVVLNGRNAAETYRAITRYETIVEGEALRYRYLNRLSLPHPIDQTGKRNIDLIILAGFIPSATTKMLELLQTAVMGLSRPITCTLKLHPNFVVKSEDYPSLHLKIVTDSLLDLLPHYDVALSGNLTSAAVDAYLAGLKVIVMLDERSLNLSVLRGKDDVLFVSVAEELTDALQNVQPNVSRTNRQGFFHLGQDLTRWSGLLET